MSLIVKIFVNRTEIQQYHARRLEEFKGNDATHNYVTTSGDIIEHKYSDGAGELAIKLLNKCIKNV